MNDYSDVSWHSMSDKALLEQIGSYIRHHRVRKNITQVVLARNAGISRSTLSLLERGEAVMLTTLIQVLRVLDLLHVMESFAVEETASPIELAKAQRKKRRRARSRTDEPEDEESDW